MSATELGKLIDRSQSYVSAIETASIAQGQSKPITPPDDVLEALSKVLEIPLPELHTALGRGPEIEYEIDPDFQVIKEAYDGSSATGRRALKSHAELILEVNREGSIGKRAE